MMMVQVRIAGADHLVHAGGQADTWLSGRAFPSHGRDRRFNPYSHLVPAGPDPAYLTQGRDTKGLLSGIVWTAEFMSSSVR